jgi:UDP:flavonoid glycosyltransferase YjiC (YdhE family)
MHTLNIEYLLKVYPDAHIIQLHRDPVDVLPSAASLNVPYDGLIRALTARPDMTVIWCRRAMWAPGAGEDHIGRERYFDVVIEPGEIAGALDRGLTTLYQSRTRKVAPIQLLDPDEMLERSDAKRALGLEPDRPAVLLQLGSRNNFNFGSLLDDLLDWLIKRGDLQLVWLDWAIAKEEITLPASIRRVRLYPIARYLNAFDYAVSAAGYNAFHELQRSALPTLFMPNENPMMDDQLSRALYARQHRLGDCLRRQDIYRLGEVLSRFFDPIEQGERRRRLARITGDNGAIEVARIIEEAAYSVPAREWLTSREQAGQGEAGTPPA